MCEGMIASGIVNHLKVGVIQVTKKVRNSTDLYLGFYLQYYEYFDGLYDVLKCLNRWMEKQYYYFGFLFIFNLVMFLKVGFILAIVNKVLVARIELGMFHYLCKVNINSLLLKDWKLLTKSY